MTSKLKLILPAVAAMTIISVSPASAFWPFDTTTNKPDSAQSTLLDKIIAKFNLNKDEVNQVVTDYRGERRQQMQSQYEERLNQAVADGKITEAQKQLILDKRAELQKEWDANQSQRDQHRQQLQDWAKQNGIDISYLMMGQGRGRGGMMKGEGMGMVRGK